MLPTRRPVDARCLAKASRVVKGCGLAAADGPAQMTSPLLASTARSSLAVMSESVAGNTDDRPRGTV